MTANGVGTCGADDNQAQAGHLIAFAWQVGGNETSSGAFHADGTTPTLLRNQTLAVCGVLGDQAHALTAEGADASEDGTGRGTPVVAFHVTQDPISGDVAPAMGTGNRQGCATIGVAYAPDHAATLTAGISSAGVSAPGRRQEDDTNITDGLIVRRLTPLECERLQGFPDGWTDVDGASDSQRYRQMGNSVAVPVFEWVLSRLVAVDASLDGAA